MLILLNLDAPRKDIDIIKKKSIKSELYTS